MTPRFTDELPQGLTPVCGPEGINYVLGFLSHAGVAPTNHPYRELRVRLRETEPGEWAEYAEVWGCHDERPTINTLWYNLLSE
jgi:hypothetical protein